LKPEEPAGKGEELEMSHCTPPGEEEVDVIPKSNRLAAPSSPTMVVDSSRVNAQDVYVHDTEPQVWKQTPEKVVEKGPNFYPENEVG